MKKRFCMLMAMCVLAIAPATFAQSSDSMKHDDAQSGDTMKHDDMKQDDAMKHDDMKKDDGMKKDEMASGKKKHKKKSKKHDDAMKQDDGMKHDDMKKDYVMKHYEMKKDYSMAKLCPPRAPPRRTLSGRFWQ